MTPDEKTNLIADLAIKLGRVKTELAAHHARSDRLDRLRDSWQGSWQAGTLTYAEAIHELDEALDGPA